MKIHIIEPWERFWKSAYNYIIDNDLPPYDTLFYITLTPTIYHQRDKKLSEFLKVMAAMYNIKAPELSMLPTLYVLRVFETYFDYRRLPAVNNQGLKYMYRDIMHDYMKCDGEYTLEDVIDQDEDVSNTILSKRSWYVITHVLHEDEVENVRKMLQHAYEEEQKMKHDPNVSVLVDMFKSKQGNVHDAIYDIIEKHATDEKMGIEAVSKIIGGRIENGEFRAPAEMVMLYYGLILDFTHRTDEIDKQKEQYKVLEDRYDQMHRAYIGNIRFLTAEREEFIERIHKAENTKQVVYIDGEDKYKVQIESLTANYERQIHSLKEELAGLKEMVEGLLSEQQQAVTGPIKLKELTSVAYFALDDPQLDAYMLKYNIELKHYSPLTPPKHVPDMPIAFNIDIASHKVWNKIKNKKPLIVTGSNKDIIASKITSWLN